MCCLHHCITLSPVGVLDSPLTARNGYVSHMMMVWQHVTLTVLARKKKKTSNWSCNRQVIFTPCFNDGYNSFDIVCLCVRVCVTTLLAKWTDIWTWISGCRSSGWISRSSSKVKVIDQRSRSPGQKRFLGLPIMDEAWDRARWDGWVVGWLGGSYGPSMIPKRSLRFLACSTTSKSYFFPL